jgi:hypothetical protein
MKKSSRERQMIGGAVADHAVWATNGEGGRCTMYCTTTHSSAGILATSDYALGASLSDQRSLMVIPDYYWLSQATGSDS